jgi:hypothetical protein
MEQAQIVIAGRRHGARLYGRAALSSLRIGAERTKQGKRQARVTLAVRFDGHAPPAAFRSLARLVAHLADTSLLNDLILVDGGHAHEMRDLVVSHAIGRGTGVTHVMWVDPHLVVPDGVVEALLAGRGSVVGGVYPRREAEEGLAYRLEPFEWVQPAPGGLRRVDGTGLGCTLVESSVYRRLGEHCHGRVYGMPEESTFFGRCREAGFDVWVDTRVAARDGRSDLEAPAWTATRSDRQGRRKVALAMPMFESVPPAAAVAQLQMIRRAVEIGVLQGLYFVDGLFYDRARNSLVEQILASGQGYTHVVWIDSDVVPPMDAPERLLATGKTVVGGLYLTKGAHRPAVFHLDPLRPYLSVPGGLVQVDGYGLGCALVETGVYESMAAAFGDRRWHEFVEGDGEDVFFFRRLQKMGVEAWLDGSLRCGHVKDQVVTQSAGG